MNFFSGGRSKQCLMCLLTVFEGVKIFFCGVLVVGGVGVWVLWFAWVLWVFMALVGGVVWVL